MGPMRCFAAVTCAVLLGCATSNTTPGSTTPVETIRVASVNGASVMAETHPAEGAYTATIDFSIDRVWAALRASYDSVAVPVAIFETGTHTVGNGQIRLRRRLGDVALSKYINCGSTQGGPSADSYEVQLSVVTTATAAGAIATNLSTMVQGQARPITISSEYVRCTT